MKTKQIFSNREDFLDIANHTATILKSFRLPERHSKLMPTISIINLILLNKAFDTKSLERLKNLIRIGDLILVEENKLTMLFVADHNSILNISTRIMNMYEQAGYQVFAGISSFPEDGKRIDALIERAKDTVQKLLLQSIDHQCRIAFCNVRQQFKAQEKMRMNTEIIRALNGRDYGFYYQPKVDVAGNVVGAEALLRWLNYQPGGKPPGPAEFIPIAETTGIIIQIGEYVFQHNAEQVKHWHERGISVPISINVSTKQIEHKHYDFLKFAREMAERYEMPAGLLELEITETAILHDSDHSRKVIHELRQAGYKIVLDDFGMGHSTLSHLLLPIDAVKIDKKFVDGVLNSKPDIAIIKAIISVAKDLGVTITAEGVESSEQGKVLLDMGCDNLQGYYYSKPITAQSYSKLILAGGDITTFGKPQLADFANIPYTPTFLPPNFEEI